MATRLGSYSSLKGKLEAPQEGSETSCSDRSSPSKVHQLECHNETAAAQSVKLRNSWGVAHPVSPSAHSTSPRRVTDASAFLHRDQRHGLQRVALGDAQQQGHRHLRSCNMEMPGPLKLPIKTYICLTPLEKKKTKRGTIF